MERAGRRPAVQQAGLGVALIAMGVALLMGLGWVVTAVTGFVPKPVSGPLTEGTLLAAFATGVTAAMLMLTGAIGAGLFAWFAYDLGGRTMSWMSHAKKAGKADGVTVYTGRVRGDGFEVKVDFETKANATQDERDAAFLSALAQKAEIDYLAIGERA